MRRVDKISIFLVIVTLMFSRSYVIFAADITRPLPAQVFVEQVFEVSADPLSIDFESVDPTPSGATEFNTTAPKFLDISCDTNNNVPWEVYIHLISPLASSMFTIPNENFHWRIESTTGKGTLESEGHLDIVPYSFYTANNSEFVTVSPVKFNLEFSVTIPINQAAGTYSATMLVKMKEARGIQEVVTPVDFELKVNPRLSLTVSPSSLEFGTVDPGQKTGAKGLNITCSANNNNPWSVSIQAESELTSGFHTIPNENFYWSVETGYGQTGYGRTISIVPDIFYRSSIDEYITTSPVELGLTFDIAVPPKQPGGRYITNLTVTMTEDIVR